MRVGESCWRRIEAAERQSDRKRLWKRERSAAINPDGNRPATSGAVWAAGELLDWNPSPFSGRERSAAAARTNL